MHVALLRGVNLGGRNKLPMAALSAMFEAEGCTAVRTYIQSGNIVFSASEVDIGGLPERISARIEADFAISVPIVLRSAVALETVVAGNPFLARGADPATLHVAFLSREPEPERVDDLDPQRSPPDEFEVVGADVYLYLPAGVGRSKLTNAWFDSRLGVVSTARNWRTVLRLLEMATA